MSKPTRQLPGGLGPDPKVLVVGNFNPLREGKVLQVILNGDSDGTNKGILDFLLAHPPADYQGEIRLPTVRYFTKRAVQAKLIEAYKIHGQTVYVPLANGPVFAKATERGLAFRNRVLEASNSEPIEIQTKQHPTGSSASRSRGGAKSAERERPTSPQELERRRKTLDELDQLSQQRHAMGRREQQLIREILLAGNDFGQCAICSESYPAQFLVAAHIKRRADCDDSERRNLSNVMLACRFGCDELFERGYLKVVDGVIELGSIEATTPPVERRLEELTGKPCASWSSENANFFEWRAEHSRNALD